MHYKSDVMNDRILPSEIHIKKLPTTGSKKRKVLNKLIEKGKLK